MSATDPQMAGVGVREERRHGRDFGHGRAEPLAHRIEAHQTARMEREPEPAVVNLFDVGNTAVRMPVATSAPGVGDPADPARGRHPEIAPVILREIPHFG